MPVAVDPTARRDSGPAGDPSAPLLAIDDLRVDFRTRHGVAHALNGVTLSVRRGETMALLGESGSGKSVTAQAVMGILDTPPAVVAGGSVRFAGEDLLTMGERQRRAIRGPQIAMVFQDALASLNPVATVGWQIAEVLRVHGGMSRRDARRRTVELMDRVRIPAAAERIDDYPHQFSGGMRQRIMIAMALALDPQLLIADEPTTALDVTVQAQIMSLLAELQAQSGMAILLITHDLGVVAETADRIAVMYAGRIVEQASAAELYRSPAHPYTEALLRSVPRIDLHERRLRPISGSPPNLLSMPPGCPFHPRCPPRRDVCATTVPPLVRVAPGRISACLFAEEVLHDHR